MQRYGEIVVVGGGCYGSYYVRQLRRARDAGALEWSRLIVVDHDPGCRVAGDADGVALVVRDWALFFDEYLAQASRRATDEIAADAIVPSPLMPHLMSHWVTSRARVRWPGRSIRLSPLDGALDVPWQRRGDDGTHYVSFAEWTCPINCIEPARCPHTRGERTWSLPPALARYAAAEREAGRPVEGPFVFHCVHRAFGVGMLDVRDILAADQAIAERGSSSAGTAFLVGTASHCHGALRRIVVG